MKNVKFVGIVTYSENDKKVEKTFDNVNDYNKLVTELLNKNIVFNSYTETGANLDHEETSIDYNIYDKMDDKLSEVDDLAARLFEDGEDVDEDKYKDLCNRVGEEIEQMFKKSDLTPKEFRDLSKSFDLDVTNCKKEYEDIQKDIESIKEDLKYFSKCSNVASTRKQFYTSLKYMFDQMGGETEPQTKVTETKKSQMFDPNQTLMDLINSMLKNK